MGGNREHRDITGESPGIGGVIQSCGNIVRLN